MKKIKKPNITQEQICSSFAKLEYTDRILKKSVEYNQDLYNVKKFLDDENSFILQNDSYKDYMKKMYSNRFSSSSPSYEASYKIYKELRNTAKVCPYCGYITREVSQLDHYLPKSIFPSFSITANNLVPICKECNEKKDNYYSTNKENMLLHPYYDNMGDEIFNFIKCHIVENLNIGFDFYIEKLESWDDITFKRVKFHFNKMNLKKLYQADFIADFDSFMVELKGLILLTGQPELIPKMLEIKAESFKTAKIKPWSYAGFMAMLKSNWCLNTYISFKGSQNIDVQQKVTDLN